MYETILEKHNGVGIDIDITLINGPNSSELVEWCRKNTHRNLHLITFRNNNNAHTLEYELLGHGVNINWFRGIHFVPFEISEPFWNMSNSVDRCVPGQPEWQTNLAAAGVSEEKYHAIAAPLVEWKAKKCKELGLTVLIDDMPDLTLAGCEKYGVSFVNSLDYHGW